MIVVEGQTEKLYFERLKESLRLASISFDFITKSSTPDKMVDSVRKKAGRRKDIDEVWYVFDSEVNQKENVRGHCSAAQKIGCEIGLSNPCFEFWLLLHISDYGKTNLNPEDLEKDLIAESEKHFKIGYSKKESKIQKFYNILFEDKDIAESFLKAAADRLDKHLGSEAGWEFVLENNPSTNVHVLAKTLLNEYKAKSRLT
ncbi:RloB family protein [Sedimentisphaera salicampi]|uniref:RloB family protein n=1 Tax=Sedimentisphaera salicampi TaxID=1941349 RepID=UPI00137A76F5|nr:RloB family protein [Sedimentisphaera salicampi]